MFINSFGAVGECLFQLDIATNPADRFYFDIIINGGGPDGIARAWPEPHPCRPADRWRAGGAGYHGCADAGFCAIGHRCVAAMAIIAGAGGDCISDISGVAGMDWRLPTQIYAKPFWMRLSRCNRHCLWCFLSRLGCL